jgi:hypothetical protein
VREQVRAARDHGGDDRDREQPATITPGAIPTRNATAEPPARGSRRSAGTLRSTVRRRRYTAVLVCVVPDDHVLLLSGGDHGVELLSDRHGPRVRAAILAFLRSTTHSDP